jgi:glutathione S-transferase
LAKKHKTADHWYPEDPKQRAKVDMFLDWLHTTFRPAIAGYQFAHTMGPKAFGISFTEKQVETAQKKALNVLKEFNDQYFKQPGFISGQSQPTIADIFAFGELVQYLVLTEESNISEWKEFAKYPNVQAWAKKMESLPHVDKVHAGLRKYRTILKSKL